MPIVEYTDLIDKSNVFVISGPSGVGKDTLIKHLMLQDDNLTFVITATTRQIRTGEVDGVDYNFYTTTEFEKMIQNNQFFEYRKVYGEYKGIPKQNIISQLATGKDIILRVDVFGALEMQQKIPNAVLIFIAPSSTHDLETRLNTRGSDPAKDIENRIFQAENELSALDHFDYIVINKQHQLDDTLNTIRCIIVSERNRIKKMRTENYQHYLRNTSPANHFSRG